MILHQTRVFAAFENLICEEMSILKDFRQEKLSQGADESLIDVRKVNDRKKSKKNLERQYQLIFLHSEEIALLNDISEDQYLEEYGTAQTA